MADGGSMEVEQPRAETEKEEQEQEQEPSQPEEEQSNPEEQSEELAQPASEEAEPAEAETEEKTEKLYKFPLGRVKSIMKMDPEVNLASQDAVFLVTKATELFVQSLATESYHYTSQNKKKTVSRNDVDTAIDAVDCLAFLEGAIED